MAPYDRGADPLLASYDTREDKMNHQTAGASASEPAALPPGVAYLNSIHDTARITGRSRSAIYLMIERGELEARKDGTRILVTGASIVARTENLPRAVIGAGKQATAAA